MPVDHIRYDILAQEALRGLVRKVLAETARHGLPGDHHFYISLQTRAPGVKISPRLREQYPETITVVMQHQFWDLKVGEDQFEVGMSFGGIPERLVVPYEAITAFADPSVQFALQFETLTTDADETAPAPQSERPRPAARHGDHPAAQPAEADAASSADDATAMPEPASDAAPSAEVVRLDRFRKK